MKNYVKNKLYTLLHFTSKWAQYAPHQWTRPNYGATNQLKTLLETPPKIPEEHKRKIKKRVVTLL